MHFLLAFESVREESRAYLRHEARRITFTDAEDLVRTGIDRVTEDATVRAFFLFHDATDRAEEIRRDDVSTTNVHNTSEVFWIRAVCIEGFHNIYDRVSGFPLMTPIICNASPEADRRSRLFSTRNGREPFLNTSHSILRTHENARFVFQRSRKLHGDQSGQHYEHLKLSANLKK